MLFRGIFEALQRGLEESQRARVELARANEGLTEANRGLQHARDEAIQANRSKSIFLANMSHELRTPLNAITGYTELLLEDEEPCESEHKANLRVHGLSRILSSSVHLSLIISDILELSNIETGQIQVSREAFCVRPVLQELYDTIQPLLDQQDNYLEIDLPEQTLELQTDQSKLSRILLALLDNANKFTQSGTITVHVESHIERNVAGVRFRIVDTGIGIPEHKLSGLMDPFVQADGSHTRQHGGTGIGLAITKHFCELLHGTLSVKSTMGEGSCFAVWIPAILPETDPKGRGHLGDVLAVG